MGYDGLLEALYLSTFVGGCTVYKVGMRYSIWTNCNLQTKQDKHANISS